MEQGSENVYCAHQNGDIGNSTQSYMFCPNINTHMSIVYLKALSANDTMKDMKDTSCLFESVEIYTSMHIATSNLLINLCISLGPMLRLIYIYIFSLNHIYICG